MSMLILPIRRAQQVVGMVYAENPALPPGGLAEEDAILLRSFKNLLLMNLPVRG